MIGFFNNIWVRRLGIFVALPVALVFGFFKLNYPTCTFRYKLTAEVMTPDGLKTGSSVIEVSYSSVHPLPNPGRWRADKVTGEAVYVDLGGGKNLFVLLGADRWERTASDIPLSEIGFDGIEGGYDAILERKLAAGSLNALWLPVNVYKLGRIPGHEREMARRVSEYRGAEPVEVPLANIPLVGSFEDLQKPETFNTLIPADVPKVLGEGYVLRFVKIQIVDYAVGELIRSVLPWLPKYLESNVLKCKSNNGSKVGTCSVWPTNFSAQNLPPEYIN